MAVSRLFQLIELQNHGSVQKSIANNTEKAAEQEVRNSILLDLQRLEWVDAAQIDCQQILYPMSPRIPCTHTLVFVGSKQNFLSSQHSIPHKSNPMNAMGATKVSPNSNIYGSARIKSLDPLHLMEMQTKTSTQVLLHIRWNSVLQANSRSFYSVSRK